MSEEQRISVACFPTELGWFALAGREGEVSDLVIGYPSAAAARVAVHRALAGEGAEEAGLVTGARLLVDDAAFPALRRRLACYAAGERVDFGDVRLAERPLSAFQRRVLEVCRAIPYGERLSYAELAELAGYRGAARAVGNVMAGNRVPIVIPCHRVVGAGGRLGGYSSPQGVGLKARLLELEGRCRLRDGTLMPALA